MVTDLVNIPPVSDVVVAVPSMPTPHARANMQDRPTDNHAATLSQSANRQSITFADHVFLTEHNEHYQTLTIKDIVRYST